MCMVRIDGTSWILSRPKFTEKKKILFAMYYTRGCNWNLQKPVMEQDLVEHTKYMVELDGKNILVVAGPLMDDTGD